MNTELNPPQGTPPEDAPRPAPAIPETHLFPEIFRAVLSCPTDGSEYRKYVLERLGDRYQLEKHAQGKVYHENLTFQQAAAALGAAFGAAFRQYNAWDGRFEYMLKISKKGKLLRHRTPCTQAEERRSHDREKAYILPEGEIVPPLVEMGIFTKDGRVVKSMYDKYRQINRFVEIVDDGLGGWDPSVPLHVLDFGCGKSYLTFILYHYFVNLKGYDVRMTGLDLKRDVVDRCNAAARKFGYDRLEFRTGDINGFHADGPVDAVIALHACDTATDYALANAVHWGAAHIFAVPCCQHQLNGQLAAGAFPILTRYGIVKERAAALMTDAIRANLLTCCGYKTQVMEFVDLSHTAKNLMIRAAKAGIPGEAKKAALDEVLALTGGFGLSPLLLDLLRGDICGPAAADV